MFWVILFINLFKFNNLKMQNYHQRQLNNNKINNNNPNYHQQPQQPNFPKESNYSHTQPLNDEEFLLYYKQKYPEEYEKF